MNSTITTGNQKQERNNDNRRSDVGNLGEPTYQAAFSPRFDIWQGEEELILFGDLPGVEPDSLEIQFENRQLTIHGRACRRAEGVNYLYSEYDISDFHRSFAIDESINSEAISAELHAGVLTLHLPKSEAAKPRRIEVKAS